MSFLLKRPQNLLQHGSLWMGSEVGRNPPGTHLGCAQVAGVSLKVLWNPSFASPWSGLLQTSSFPPAVVSQGKSESCLLPVRGWCTAQPQGWWEHELLFINWVIPHVESLHVYKTAWVGWSNEQGLSFGLIPLNWWEWKKPQTNLIKTNWTVAKQTNKKPTKMKDDQAVLCLYLVFFEAWIERCLSPFLLFQAWHSWSPVAPGDT